MSEITVCVGMSGGVDSTTTAHLLLKEGYKVFGATMYLFDVPDSEGLLKPPKFIGEAKQICEGLGIEHYVVDLREAFLKNIISPFKEGFLSGITPNPCTTCNAKIKYGLFMDEILRLGATHMATGHYVCIEHRAETGTWHLMKGLTNRKDQSYYLHALSEERLKRLILPLGQYADKSEVRAIAGQFNQGVSEKKDSLGICFTQGKTPFEYLKNQLPEAFGHGNFVLKNGTVIGQHDGYFQFTIGQKKGLPKAAVSGEVVIGIEAQTGNVLLGNESDLYRNTLSMQSVNWIHEPAELPWRGVFRVCTWGYDLKGIIDYSEETKSWQVSFDEPVRAIAKGQACVIYKDNEILGGGIID